MNQNKSNGVRIVIIVVAIVAVLLNIFVFTEKPEFSSVPAQKTKLTSVYGLELSPRTDTVKGDPNFTEKQMRQHVYKLIQTYKQRTGCFPANGKNHDLDKDIYQHLKEYGFSTVLDAMKAFNNPDTRLSDQWAGGKPDEKLIINPYVFPLRPDGSDKCSQKVGNGRDILAMTDLYLHMNNKASRNDKTSFSPVGFYVVLWEDGSVEKIPWNKARFQKLPDTPANFTGIIPGQTAYGALPMFEGQYGIEKIKTESFTEHFHMNVPKSK